MKKLNVLLLLLTILMIVEHRPAEAQRKKVAKASKVYGKGRNGAIGKLRITVNGVTVTLKKRIVFNNAQNRCNKRISETSANQRVVCRFDGVIFRQQNGALPVFNAPAIADEVEQDDSPSQPVVIDACAIAITAGCSAWKFGYDRCQYVDIASRTLVTEIYGNTGLVYKSVTSCDGRTVYSIQGFMP
jgi:hypothetical protein